MIGFFTIMRRAIASSAKHPALRKRMSRGSRITLVCLELESREVPVLPDPSAWWKLDDAAANGAIVDSSPAATYPATASNFGATSGQRMDVAPFAGGINRLFDGVDDVVQTDAAMDLSGDKLTISAWVKVLSFKASAPSISSIAGMEEGNNAALLRLGDAGAVPALTGDKPQFVLSIGGAQVKLNGNTALAKGYWSHIAGTYDGSVMRLYVNGQLDAEKVQVGNITANAKFALGCNPPFTDRRTLHGHLDGVRVYKSALTAAEIAEVATGSAPSAAGKAIWPVRAKPGAPSGQEYWMANGFGDGSPNSAFKFHEGIDILASGNGGEVVVATRAGKVIYSDPAGFGANNGFILVEVLLPGGTKEYDFYIHLKSLAVPRSALVSQGQVLGIISDVFADKSRHLHLSVFNRLPLPGQMPGRDTVLNPFFRFEAANQDPLNLRPVLADTNDDATSLIITKQGDATWASVGATVGGDVDIIADVRDFMHPSTWGGANPQIVGYFIRPTAINGKGVKTAAANAYILANFDDNWFPGIPAAKFSQVYADSGVLDNGAHTITGDLRANPTDLAWPQTRHFIVTNTAGTNGRPGNVSGGQYWNTDAGELRFAPLGENDVAANYAGVVDAAINAKARFKDGNYVVSIVLADLIAKDAHAAATVRVVNFERKADVGFNSAMLPVPAGVPAATDNANSVPYLPNFVPTASVATIASAIPVDSPVGINGEQYYPDTLMYAYILPHKAAGWAEGEDLNATAEHVTKVKSDADGVVALTDSGWTTPNTGGDFDIVIDYNNDGKFTWKLDGLHGFTVNSGTSNNSPVAIDDSAFTRPGSPVTINALDNDYDPDDDPLTVTSYTQPAVGSVVHDGSGSFTFFPPSPPYTGSTTFTYTIEDGNGGTDTGTVTINVINGIPDAVDDEASTSKGSPVTVGVIGNDTDPDGDSLVIAGLTQPAQGIAALNPDGSVTYTPSAGFTGTDTFTYTAADSYGGTDTATVTIDITNNAPAAVEDEAFTTRNTAVAIPVLANDSDPDGDPLTIVAAGPAANGSVSFSPGTVTYTPAAGFAGTDFFTYTISDGYGGTASATVTVVVPNLPPVAVDDLASTPGNTAVTIAVLQNDSDIDGDALSVFSVTQGANGSVTTNGTTVTYTPNSIINGVDSFTYTMTDGKGGYDTASVTVSIGSVLSINDVSVSEGDAGTTNATFTVTLSFPTLSTVTVDYNTANDSATSPSDFAATGGTLTFAPTETSKIITVAVVGDTKYEVNENFFVNLSNAVNAGIADNQGTGTIRNDDAVPTIVIGDVTNIEGNSGTVSYNFPVILSNASEPDVTVAYTTTAGTAGSPGDYTAVSGTLTFAAGQTSMLISVLVNGELAEENHETFSLSLSSPVNATINDGTGVGTIQNDDTSISIQDVTTGEYSLSGAILNLALSKPSALSVTVNYNTANGTALAGSDYTAASGTVTFNPGEVSKSITIGITNDNVYEGNENFLVNLTNSTNGTIVDAQAIVTIQDDESQPSVSIMASPYLFVQEGNSGTTTFTFTVSLSNASTQTVSMHYASADGTASAGSDYQATSGTLTFAPLETSKTILVTIYGDTTYEDYESFTMNLSNIINATSFMTSATGSISNDD